MKITENSKRKIEIKEKQKSKRETEEDRREMKSRLILASGSPRRKELLEQIGAEFEILPAKGEEVITSDIPSQVVMELSAQKAEEVSGRYKEELGEGKGSGEERGSGEPKDTVVILGADTVVAYENKILGKPKDEADAVRMLQMLAGNTHSVFTGVTLIIEKAGKTEKKTFFSETKVTMYPMSKEEIQAYVATGEPMDKAGSYGIQGRCAAYIERIEGDYNNVVGLPVALVYQTLKKIIDFNTIVR